MKIKGILFILFTACVGHIGAMEPDKGIEQKKQGMQQGTKVPSLTQLAAIAKAKDLVPLLQSAQSPQQAINAYRTEKTSDFFTLPTDLQLPLLAEIGRQYYISYGIELNTGTPWGLSIQDYLNSPILIKKMPQTETDTFGNKLNLQNMKINNLQGLQKIPNIGTVQSLYLANNKLTTIQPNAFAGLPNLTTLNLSYNQLKDIQPDAFADPTKLEGLSLNFNQLKDIQPDAFANLTNLTTLNLSHNQLKDIQPDAFADLTNLRGLRLDKNQLNKKTKEAIKEALPQSVDIEF